MKRISALVVAVAMIAGVSAQAVYDPNWERPILKAEMKEFDADGHEIAIGQDRILTMHQRDGQKEATQFSLVEEKRIFCVRAPCPQPRVTTKFTVTDVVRVRAGKKYLAIEKLENIPPHVRIAPRRLEVVDYGSRVLFGAKDRWNARILGFSQPVRVLLGTPEPVYTIQ